MRSVVSAAVRMLLRVYPESFRERFGPDLESAVEDRLDTVWARSTLMVPLLAARVLLDVAVSAAHECIRPTFHTGSPAHCGGSDSGRHDRCVWGAGYGGAVVRRRACRSDRAFERERVGLARRDCCHADSGASRDPSRSNGGA